MKRQYYPPHSRIVPKILYYNSDGTGRDSYINVNSGGICRGAGLRSNLGDRRDLVFSNLKKKMDFGIPPKVVHYSSDGTGRDNYIVINEGGLTLNDLKDYQFINSLRGYKKIKKIDFFEQTQKVLPLLELEKKKKNLQCQKILDEKLAKPRNYPDPYEGVFYRPKTPAMIRALSQQKMRKYY